MKNHKKTIFFIIFIMIGVGGTIFGLDKVEANRILKMQWINNYIEEKDKMSNKNNILEVVLKDTKYTEWEDVADRIGLNISFADLLGDSQKELLLTLSLSSKNSIVAVYQKQKDDYEYIGLIDEFFDIRGIQAIPMEKQEKDIIIIREFVDQMTGAFEKGTYLRGYIWNNGQFEMVLSIIEDYTAYWNEMWDQPSKTNPFWLKIEEKSTIQWENGPYPVIRIIENQFYYKSKVTNRKEMPKEEEYQLVDSKDVLQIYYWNEKYQHFVMSEGKDIKTGETVAIIEDLSLSPFQLAGFEQNQYRIKRQDGTIETVPKSQITKINSPLKKSEDFLVFLVFLHIMI